MGSGESEVAFVDGRGGRPGVTCETGRRGGVGGPGRGSHAGRQRSVVAAVAVPVLSAEVGQGGELERVRVRLAEALAVTERQARQIRMLRRVATDEVPHLHRRDCPARWRYDEQGRFDFDTRDHYCPACRILIDTDGSQR